MVLSFILRYMVIQDIVRNSFLKKKTIRYATGCTSQILPFKVKPI